MAEGSRGYFEGTKKVTEQEGEVIQLRPESSGGKPEERSVEAPKKLREQDIAIARREALRLQLGGAPTQRQLSSEQMRLNEQLGALRAERMELKKELLKAGAERSEERSSRLKEIETEISLIEVRRTDIGYWLSLGETEGADQAADLENSSMGEIDALRRDRSALEQELDQIGTGVLSYFKRRSLKSQIEKIDQRTRALMNGRRSEELIAAK